MATQRGGYVDGFVLTVPKKKRAIYKKMAGMMAKASKKYGVLAYMECRGDDMVGKAMMGGMKFRHFPEMAKAKAGEEVWFSFLIYKSRTHRDQANKRMQKDMMNDPKMDDMPMPFDMKRMAYGGFKVEVSA